MNTVYSFLYYFMFPSILCIGASIVVYPLNNNIFIDVRPNELYPSIFYLAIYGSLLYTIIERILDKIIKE